MRKSSNLHCLQIAFVSTTAEGYKQTRQWVNYHRVIGVTHFYLFVDGVAARPEVCFSLLSPDWHVHLSQMKAVYVLSVLDSCESFPPDLES